MVFEVLGVQISIIGAFIGLLFGSMWDNAISPKFHGTGQPHEPNSNIMMTRPRGYIRLIIGKVGGQVFGTLTGSLIGPKLESQLINQIHNASTEEMLAVILFLVWISYSYYESKLD